MQKIKHLESRIRVLEFENKELKELLALHNPDTYAVSQDEADLSYRLACAKPGEIVRVKRK